MKINEYFANKQEALPQWLKNHKRGDRVNLSEVLKYRTFFYPGSYIDGVPLGLINYSQYCHTFIYVDIGVKKANIKKELSKENSFNGYKLVDLIELKESDLVKKWTPHFTPSEDYKYEINNILQCSESDAFTVLAIFELKDLTSENKIGSDRFCVLYIGGDANATYDALFVNENYHTPNIVYISANFAGEAGNFYKNTPFEKIARLAPNMPEYLLVLNCGEFAWHDYEKLDLEPGISHKYNRIYLYRNIK